MARGNTKFRANATEVNKTPHVIRFIWSIVLKDGSVTVATTYQTLNRLNEHDIADLYITDLAREELLVKKNVMEELDFFVNLKEEWRKNYFNVDWAIDEYFN